MGKREDFFLTYKYNNYNYFVLISHLSSDCSHVELLFTHVATKEHHLCIVLCICVSAKKSVRIFTCTCMFPPPSISTFQTAVSLQVTGDG